MTPLLWIQKPLKLYRVIIPSELHLKGGIIYYDWTQCLYPLDSKYQVSGGDKKDEEINSERSIFLENWYI